MKAEMTALVLSLGMGAVFALIYDLIRIFRRVVKHGMALVSGEDLLFWIVSSVQAFAFFVFVNKGKYRFFMFFAMLMGAMVYRMILSEKIVGYCSFFLNKLVEIFGNILKKITLWVKIKGQKKKGNKTRGGNIEKTEKS